LGHHRLSSLISLRPIDPSNYQECIALSVAPDQQRFVASNLRSLADAYVWREAAETYAVYADEEMVGFGLLFPFADGADDDAIPEPGTERGYIIVRLMVDHRFQGHGYGRAALDAILDLVRGRGLGAVRLSVVPQNVQALEFYRRNGFAETGEIHGGEIVMERQL
jgi:diamine N-acetyltransferase